MLSRFRQKKNNPAQLELELGRRPELDRNFQKGGRSFYFFDFDDNIAALATPTYIFHRETGAEQMLSTREFGEHSGSIGKSGPYKDYELKLDGEVGSFRSFRDRNLSLLERLLGRRQMFVEDLMTALGLPDFHWKGPSWNCFYHAVFNKRPLSLITARGHQPETIKEGVRLLVSEGHIPHEPNYLGVYPVNCPDVRRNLGKGFDVSVAEMKQVAIRASVQRAFEIYGQNEHHRFGMSDDDPKNVDLIIDEMTRLKRIYPKNSFFVFDTHKGQFLRREVFDGRTEDTVLASLSQQLSLFD